jgi:hypothetical protein
VTPVPDENSEQRFSKNFGKLYLRAAVIALVILAVGIELCLIAMIFLPKSPLGRAAFIDGSARKADSDSDFESKAAEPGLKSGVVSTTVSIDATESWDAKFVDAQELMNSGKISDASGYLQTLKSELDKNSHIDTPVLRRKLVLARLIECAIGLRDRTKITSGLQEFQEVSRIPAPNVRLPEDILKRPSSEQLALIGAAIHGQKRIEPSLMEAALKGLLARRKSLDPMTRATATVYLSLCLKADPQEREKAGALAKEGRILVAQLPESPESADLLYDLAVIYWDFWHQPGEGKSAEVDDICRKASAMLNDQTPNDYVRLATIHGFLAYLERVGAQKNMKLSLEHSRRALDELENVSRKDSRGELARAMVERQVACALQAQNSAECLDHYSSSLRIMESPVAWEVAWLDEALKTSLEPFITICKKSRPALAAGFAQRVKLMGERERLAAEPSLTK